MPTIYRSDKPQRCISLYVVYKWRKPYDLHWKYWVVRFTGLGSMKELPVDAWPENVRFVTVEATNKRDAIREGRRVLA